ncbi:MAG: hypothetical protein QM802_14010 [Agriterribacter sp.]
MKKICFFVFSIISLLGFGQNLKPLDLSKKGGISESVIPQSITSLILVNGLAIPGTVYSIDLTVKHTPQGPLSIPNSTPQAPAGLQGNGDNLEKAIDELEKVTDESQIPKAIEKLQVEMKKADPLTSAQDLQQADQDISATTIHYALPMPISIGKNDVLEITITRGSNKWVFIFKNEQPSHWTTYYGFTYIPDAFTKFQNYYSNQQDDGSFLISKMNGSNKNVFQNVSPTAMFTYRFFNKKPDAVLKFGLTAGIFYNTEILGAMFGPSLVIGDNVTLNTGVSFVQKYKLKGQYKDGQKITTSLDFDQLHDKIWSYDMFISIGLNIPELFNRNKKASSGSTSTE